MGAEELLLVARTNVVQVAQPTLWTCFPSTLKASLAFGLFDTICQ
jgi:hypothetical protein